MAVSLVNDGISYCTERGSPVYTCSLDAQGAFDAIPHAVLFRKAMDVLPDHGWMIIVNWYRAICVQIKYRICPKRTNISTQRYTTGRAFLAIPI